MKSILILSFSKLQHDARVKRQIEFFKGDYALTVAAFDELEYPNVRFIRLERPSLTLFRKAILSFFLFFRIYSVAYELLHGHRSTRSKLSGSRFDCIIANDIESLPLAFGIDPTARVVFDAHEYAPRHFEDKRMWRIFFQPFNIYLCRTYIPKVAAMTTVGTALAREYEENFGLRPEVITNAAWYHSIGPSAVDGDRIRMIHHGGATVSRRLELMIDMMKLLDDRFTLDLMLIVPEYASPETRNYINLLRERAAGDNRIRILPPLKSEEIVSFINRYDLGVFLLPPVNFNYANTLPNKLFDFIQARLGIAIGPTPEMAEVVNRYKLGVVSQEFTPESLAAELRKLTTAEVEQFKKNSGVAAAELSAERNKEKMRELVRRVLGE